MHIELRTIDIDSAEFLKAYVERRLRFALSHFDARVGHILVNIAKDARGCTTCRIDTQIIPFGCVGVKESGTELFSAVDRASGRMGRLFARKLERARQALTSRASIRRIA